MGCEVVVRNSLATRRANPACACNMRSIPRAKSRIQIYLQLASGLTPAGAELHACVLSS
jgi:hypothetical protein